MKNLTKFIKILGFLWLALIFYFLGYFVGHKNLEFDQNYLPKITNTSLGQPKEIDFSIFWDACKAISEKYVGEYSTENMIYGAIQGMVDSLGDPYSVFLKPGENQMFLDDLSGKIEGIGAELSLKEGQLIVIAPLDDSPAQKAGLKAQDKILKINDEDTVEFSLDKAVSKIRGPSGTTVKLLIDRQGFSSPQEFNIKRETIIIKSVEWEQKDNVGIIKISQFGDDTSELAEEAAKDLAKRNLTGVILDLRNNPGGYLDASIDVASLFMDGGVVVKEVDRSGKEEILEATLEGKLIKEKIVILINGGSASASEIVAGALKDNRQAILIGEKTFGKGSVQELENLAKGSALKLTVARWLTPSGKTIDEEGISPDIEVILSSEDEQAGRDPQLEQALKEAIK